MKRQLVPDWRTGLGFTDGMTSEPVAGSFRARGRVAPEDSKLLSPEYSAETVPLPAASRLPSSFNMATEDLAPGASVTEPSSVSLVRNVTEPVGRAAAPVTVAVSSTTSPGE